MVGVHYSHIGKYERGSSTPKSETLRRLSDSLEVSTNYLYEGRIDEVAATRLEDKDLLQMFKEIEKLSDEDKFVVKKLLNAFLTKKSSGFRENLNHLPSSFFFINPYFRLLKFKIRR